ncbi:MAG: hypothetical protein A2607_01505 [Candidatus Vogelbacteria bacterium RIFOXYD1_FULL_42_15]|uniref:Very-long-chain aldehyde decarbonylase CER1-like C-terminal domain-containing protein n=1 Tax=Candidatus Vogelbacteria bacterium RIFOXYD1_FULL_42_15 TaxID=1802437 RepID=A0A1G2QDV2_9BACT|nr:MAG: hypothetical protein A2607_01505 [Candidatus Vogelbacteria bacterium RIFOXYD1_FULL_42_15]
MTRASMAFIAHYVENWNWLLKWRLFHFLHQKPENHVYTEWLWPIYSTAAVWEMFGHKAFDVVDNFQFDNNVRCRTVLLRNFGWQFFVPQIRNRIRERILEAVLDAQKHVEVIGLGALIKDESLTKGGEWIVQMLGDQLKTPIVHGDTLTAATVFGQITRLRQKRDAGQDESVMITGSTSKIGRAVVLLLARNGIRVKMYTLNQDRFDSIKQEAGTDGVNIEWASSLADGKNCYLWVTGKSVPRGNDLLGFIPHGADVINFAVPNPVSTHSTEHRFDLNFHEGGLLAYDGKRTDLHFTMRLRPGLTYACHAGTIVHASNHWTHHEVGQVSIEQVESVWKSALDLGFYLPPLEGKIPVRSGEKEKHFHWPFGHRHGQIEHFS